MDASISKRIRNDHSEKMLHWFRRPILDENGTKQFLKKVNANGSITQVYTEYCYNIGMSDIDTVPKDHFDVLKWLLSETFQQDMFSTQSSFLEADSITNGNGNHKFIVEVGPRLSFTTAWSTNAVSICK